MAAPTHEQVAAVRAVLYKRSRMQALHDELRSIAVELNLDQAAQLGSNDRRNPPGSGPNWYVPATGAIDPAVLDAARRCKKIAAILAETAADLDGVDIPSADRSDLKQALSEEAAVWKLRERWWSDPHPEQNPEQLAATVAAHVKASLEAGHRVRAYRKAINQLEKLA